jgi:ATP-binding cassette, subfamily B, bacterial
MNNRPSKPIKYRVRPSPIWRLCQRFRGHLRPHYVSLAVAAACMTGVATLEVLQPWPLKVIFDAVLIPQEHPGAVATAMKNSLGDGDLLLAGSALSILAIAALGGFLAYGQAYLVSSVGQKLVAAIRFDLYSHLQRLSLTLHEASGTGDVLARITGDVRMLRQLLVSSLVYSVSRGLVLIGALTVMALMDWRLTLAAVSVAPLLAVVSARVGTEFKGAPRCPRNKESKFAHLMGGSIAAIKGVQAYARAGFDNERFDRHSDASSKTELAASRLGGHSDRLLKVVLALGTCAVMWYGVMRVRAGALTPGDLIVFTAYLPGLYWPIRKLAARTAHISKATVCGERILAIFDTEPEIKDRPEAVDAPRLTGRIELDNVHFAYVPGLDVLKGAKLTIWSGETVAFFSESGSGKTTIAHLLLRFYDPQSGYVKIDGRDIRDYKLASLREQISLLPHESILFNTAIRENIAYGKLDASEQEIVAAATAANAHDFIVGLPDGYDTVIGERGAAALSAGQRQHIAIARAMIRDAPIVILDEPIVGLADERTLRQALQRLAAARTCILITRDPATAQLADRVVTIRNGRLQVIWHNSPETPSPAPRQRLPAADDA